jgi:hypothetical protein
VPARVYLESNPLNVVPAEHVVPFGLGLVGARKHAFRLAQR